MDWYAGRPLSRRRRCFVHWRPRRWTRRRQVASARVLSTDTSQQQQRLTRTCHRHRHRRSTRRHHHASARSDRESNTSTRCQSSLTVGAAAAVTWTSMTPLLPAHWTAPHRPCTASWTRRRLEPSDDELRALVLQPAHAANLTRRSTASDNSNDSGNNNSTF